MSEHVQQQVTVLFQHLLTEDRKLTTLLFEEFLQSSQKWEQSRLLLALRHRLRRSKIGRMRWLSEQELMLKYNQQEGIVREIISKKIAAGDSKPHPDLPSEKLYHVWHSEEDIDEDEISQDATCHLDVGIDSNLMQQFWKNSSDFGVKSLDAPFKKPKPEKPKVVLTEAQEMEQAVKKMHKGLGSDVTVARQWISNVQSSAGLLDSMKRSLVADLEKAIDVVEVTAPFPVCSL